MRQACRSRAGRAFARRDTERPVPDYRNVGYQRPALRGAHFRLGGTSYAVNYPGADQHQRLRPRPARQRRHRGWSGPTPPATASSTASCSRARPPISRTRAITRRSIIPARVHLRSQHDGRPRGRQRRRSRGRRPDRHRARVPLRLSPEYVPARHRLSRLDDHHGLRHLVQRRHELHDLRRLYQRAPARAAPISNAYLVDYNSATGQFSNWTSFPYPNGVVGQDFLTHFQGISSTEAGVYTLGADSAQTGSSTVPCRARG